MKRSSGVGALAAGALTLAEASEQVSAALNGLKAGEVIRNLDHRNIVLRLDPELRTSVDDVRRLQLVAPGGRIMPLEDVRRSTARR